MRYLEVEGVRLSRIGVGAWQFGSREWGYGDGYAQSTAGAIVARAIDLGVNFIDTAESYGLGKSERIVGRAIRGFRDRVFVATKVFPVAPFPPIVESRAHRSMKRLGIDRIDLYQVHWPNPAVPTAVVMAGMRRVQEAGLATHVGVSNYSLSRWKAAERSLGQAVLSNQVRFSLVSPGPKEDLVPHAGRLGRVVIAYSPLGMGLLSGRYEEGAKPSGTVRRNNTMFGPRNLPRVRTLLGAVRQVAASHGATPTQVALAWLLGFPNVVAIPGASSVAQMEQNAAAADLLLTEDEHAGLTEAAEGFVRAPS